MSATLLISAADMSGATGRHSVRASLDASRHPAELPSPHDPLARSSPMLSAVVAAAALLQIAAAPQSLAGARDPVYSSDGRLALSVRGDLWVVSTDGKWTRVTSGAEWDREPAWSPDGSSLIYSSNR